MRIAILVMTLVVSLGLGALYAAPPKDPKPDVGTGRVAWFDITTTNLPTSKEFYGKLLGWQYTPVPGTDQAAEITVGGVGIGTIRRERAKPGTSNGVVYIQVSDMRASCQKAKDLGGTVVDGFPFNLPDGGGAVGLVVDPVGHPIGLYSRTEVPKDPPK